MQHQINHYIVVDQHFVDTTVVNSFLNEEMLQLLLIHAVVVYYIIEHWLVISQFLCRKLFLYIFHFGYYIIFDW